MFTQKFTGFLLLSSLMVSCGGGSDELENAGSDSTKATLAIDSTTLNESQEMTYSLPSPLQVAHVFKKSGAGFNAAYMNEDGNAAKYNTSNFKRAANFGIYSSDLAYCIFNKKSQESKDYLKACKILGEALGLSQAFETDNMGKRFDNNIGNEDSIVRLVAELHLKTDALLEQNKQKHITVISLAGAWIESMHIAAEVYKKEKNNKELISLIEQLSFAEVVSKALIANEKADTEIKSISSLVENLNVIYNAIPEVKKATDADEDVEFDKIKLDDKQLSDITSHVNDLRTILIN